MPPPRPKSSTPLILGIVFGVLLLVCGGGAFALFFFGRTAIKDTGKMMACIVSFEAVQKAVIAYAQDHNGVLPKAETWQDDVKSYLQLDPDFKDLENSPFEFQAVTKDGEWCCTVSAEKKTGISFNDELSGKKLADITNPFETPLIFETEKVGRNLHAKYVELPNETAPKFFGTPRGWFWAPVQGEVRGMEKMGAEIKTRRRKSE